MLLDDLNQTPIGEIPHGQMGDRLQRLLIVERRGQNRSGLGQKSLFPVDARPLRDISQDHREESLVAQL